MADISDTYSPFRFLRCFLPLPKQPSIGLHIPSSHPSLTQHQATQHRHTLPTYLLDTTTWTHVNQSALYPIGHSQVTPVVDLAYYQPLVQADLNGVVSISIDLDGQVRQIVGDQVWRSHHHPAVVSPWLQATGLNQESKRRVFSAGLCANRRTDLSRRYLT
jgi:hypothetical protein